MVGRALTEQARGPACGSLESTEKPGECGSHSVIPAPEGETRNHLGGGGGSIQAGQTVQDSKLRVQRETLPRYIRWSRGRASSLSTWAYTAAQTCADTQANTRTHTYTSPGDKANKNALR